VQPLTHQFQLLLNNLVSDSPSDTIPILDSPRDESLLSDELEALSAIYPGSFSSEEKSNATWIRVQLDCEGVPGSSILHIVVPNNGGYPARPPVVGVENAQLPSFVRLCVLKPLFQHACENGGDAMIFSLIAWLTDNLPTAVATPPPLSSIRALARPAPEKPREDEDDEDDASSGVSSANPAPRRERFVSPAQVRQALESLSLFLFLLCFNFFSHAPLHHHT
jgi:hypothetical protein